MSKDPAAGRFYVIQIVRMGGVIVTVFALLVLVGKAPWPGTIPREAAYILLIGGLIEAFLLPLMLARRWASKAK